MNKMKILVGAILSFILAPLIMVLSLFVFVDFLSLVQTFPDWLIYVDLVLAIVLPVLVVWLVVHFLKIKKIWLILYYALAACSIFVIIAKTNLFGRSSGHTASTAVLSDVRRFASALELYHNDKNAYPPSLEAMIPYYIAIINNRTYQNSKVCLSDKAVIEYKTVSSAGYSLEFCLEEEAGGYSRGIHFLSEQGIK